MEIESFIDAAAEAVYNALRCGCCCQRLKAASAICGTINLFPLSFFPPPQGSDNRRFLAASRLDKVYTHRSKQHQQQSASSTFIPILIPSRRKERGGRGGYNGKLLHSDNHTRGLYAFHRRFSQGLAYGSRCSGSDKASRGISLA